MIKILKKILDEINKETPRLDYIRGLIEASIEEETVTDPFVNAALQFGKVGTLSKKEQEELNIKSDEEENIPDFLRPGPIGNITS